MSHNLCLLLAALLHILWLSRSRAGSTDGKSFVTLDRRFSEAPWKPGEKRTFAFRRRGGGERARRRDRSLPVVVAGCCMRISLQHQNAALLFFS